MSTAFLHRIASGDASAVAACLDEYGGVVWSLAERYLKPLGEDVEDAVQEIFVDVWRSAGRYNPALGSEASFIATIAHRRLIDRQRRAASRPRPVPHEPHLEPRATDRPATHTPASLGEDVARAADAFNKLHTDEQQALWFALYHGMSHDRIATLTGHPLGTVKTRIRRGLIRLRELLDGSRGPATQARGVAP
ncbi:MAG: sigma-70 family RNA polymerase sigma factor [Phycisphaeraceae bacterium]|nr:MAG: sigma-70 family RNA polymerase sigma factor [Phycisphaeraceae bacterium]